MSIRPHRKLVVVLVVLLVAAGVTGGVLWRRSEDRERIASALALPTICERWPALHALGIEEEELARAGLVAATPDERRRLMATLSSFSDRCPELTELVDARRTLKTFGSPCVDQAWRSARCGDALSAVFERERVLRPVVGRMLLEHPDAWREGRFSQLLVAALSGREREKIEGLLVDGQDAGSAALEAKVGMERLRMIAREWAGRAWHEALSEWGRGGRGAWHDALTSAIGSPGAYFPHARDLQGSGVGQLLSVRGERCELVDRPGAATARVVQRPCRELVIDAPSKLNLPRADAPERLVFDARGGVFLRDQPATPLPFSFSADGALDPAASEGITADAPSLHAPRTRTLPQWSVKSLTGLVEVLPLGTAEGTVPAAITSVEEWSSPWLKHRVKLAWLSPQGLAITANDGQGWLVLGGVDYQTTLPEREECALTAPYAKSTASIRARTVVPGENGYFLLFGTYEEKRGDCDSASSETGHFVVVCRESGCTREAVPFQLDPAAALHRECVYGPGLRGLTCPQVLASRPVAERVQVVGLQR